MLFSSLGFILGFLPITLAVFYLARRVWGTRAALAWLTAASLFFYGWWNPAYLLLLVGSIGFNYIFGLWLSRPGSTRLLLALGIGANLGLLGYFKYAGFFVANFGTVAGNGPTLEGIVLPLAISFFTFQQVAYLIDAYRGQAVERTLLRYGLFVSFFPQLIAGPIVLHREMFPQLRSDRFGNLAVRNLAIGGTIFILGLGKKLILADTSLRPRSSIAGPTCIATRRHRISSAFSTGNSAFDATGPSASFSARCGTSTRRWTSGRP